MASRTVARIELRLFLFTMSLPITIQDLKDIASFRCLTLGNVRLAKAVLQTTFQETLEVS
jgi:hypothetical protein